MNEVKCIILLCKTQKMSIVYTYVHNYILMVHLLSVQLLEMLIIQ